MIVSVTLAVAALWVSLVGAAGHYYAVQVGAYRSAANADKEVAKLKSRGLDAFSRPESLGDQGTWFRVYTGLAPSRAQAESQARRLVSQGLISGYMIKEVSGPLPTTLRSETAGLPLIGQDNIGAAALGRDNSREPPFVLEPLPASPEAASQTETGGRHLASYKDRATAEKEAARLTAEGQPAMVVETTVLGQRWFRVYEKPRVPGTSSLSNDTNRLLTPLADNQIDHRNRLDWMVLTVKGNK